MNRWTKPVTVPRWQWAAYAAVFWLSFATTVLGLISRIL